MIHWVVRYRDSKGKIKDRNFRANRLEAYDFFEKQKKYGNDAQFLKVQPHSWWSRFMDSRVNWPAIRIVQWPMPRFLLAVAIVAAVAGFAWEVIK